jgi:ribosome recycling factor
MNEDIFARLQKEMDQSVSALRKDLAKIRTGRASTALLEHIVVEYYGATTPLNQLATLSAPEPRLLVIQPYDRNVMGDIEKAILKPHPE